MKRILIVGSGSIVPHHIRAAQQVGFEVVGIATREDTVRSQSITSEFGIKRFPIGASLISDLQIDALTIATSVESVFEVFSYYSKINIPIMVEKPFLTKAEHISLLKEINTINVIVGYNRRHYSSITRLRELSRQSKVLGARWLISEQPVSFDGSDQSVQTTLMTNSVHMLDLIIFMFGRPTKTHLDWCKKDSKSLQCDLRMNFANYTSLNVTLTYGIPIQSCIEVNMNGLHILLQPLELVRIFDTMDIQPPSDRSAIRTYKPRESNPWQVSELDVKYKPGFCGQYGELMNLTLGKPIFISSGVEDSIETFKLANEILDLILK